MERVVVTGLGAVTCIGNDVPSFWSNLLAGKSGIARIRAFDAAPYKTQIAAEVKAFSFDARIGKRLDRFSQFAVTAAREALEQSNLVLAEGGTSPERVGVVIGTGIGGMPFMVEQHERFLSAGPGRFHPLTIPIIIANMAASNVSIQLGLRGPNLCVSTACATGNHSIGTAMDLIRLGRADVMVAGGTESTMHPYALNGYIQLGALSARNEDPEGASRPFSLGRDGFVLAEGCGVLVLESLSHAKARGADILAEAAGFGMTSDAHHLTAPDASGSGAVGAMKEALADAHLRPDQIDYISAHGTSTPLNDLIETQAIKQVFGELAAAIPVSSIKSMVGHSLGAAAAIEAIAAVMTLREGHLPPTINLDEPDPELDLDYVPLVAREQPVAAVMSNSFAFGGQNAVTVFRQPS